MGHSLFSPQKEEPEFAQYVKYMRERLYGLTSLDLRRLAVKGWKMKTLNTITFHLSFPILALIRGKVSYVFLKQYYYWKFVISFLSKDNSNF